MYKLPQQLLEWHDYSTRLTRTDKRYTSEAFFKTKAKYFQAWPAKHNRSHPNIWVWGAGRKTRQRSKFFEKEGLVIDGYIDIVQPKSSQQTTLHYTELPAPGKMFIVSMVTKIGARKLIKDFLLKANYIEGEDFILMG